MYSPAGGTNSLYAPLSDFMPTAGAYFRNETPAAPEDDHGDSLGDAMAVVVNTSGAQGRMDSLADVDFFEFTVSGDGDVVIESAGNMDTVGWLLDGSGVELQFDDDGGDGFNFRLAIHMSAGTYYVRVEGYGGAVGDYGLSINFTADPVHSRAIPTVVP